MTMCLTHSASVFQFLFSNNSKFYAMKDNGENCFVHTLSLFAKSKKGFKSKQWLNHTINFTLHIPYRIDILEFSYFFCKQ